ncbi:hypothetical protein WMQ59_01680 [Vibrio diabolicus]|uniref:hypothetical protein n=1 Tax=Vibrio TaxID=662 RepID=UPI000D65BCDF|nr:hypothetical protein [Vibrio sp. T9]MCS0026533.1 hypothetical protein [Vibrio alginolyticus]PWF73556.1 hypothetical protein CBX98_08685 [Vibrio sp. T9]
MTTKGAFYVKNNSSDKITGYVRFKDSPEMEVRFDLNTGDKSCAYYAKDENKGPVAVEIFNDNLKISPPLSGSCEKTL